MTLKQWMEQLNKLVQENPEVRDYDLIYSTDDEGNDFHRVISDPTLVQVENLNERSLRIVGFKGDFEINDEDCNAICIN